MFQPGSLIVYGSTGVCRVEDVGPKKIMKNILKTCYTLTPLYSRETITVPVDSPVFMREVISREQAEQLIDRIPEEEPAAVPGDANAAKTCYEQALRSHSCDDLLRLVRQIYRRTQSARQSRRPPSQTDQRYMKRAADLLYGELAVALGIPREEVVPYIAQRLEAAKS